MKQMKEITLITKMKVPKDFRDKKRLCVAVKGAINDMEHRPCDIDVMNCFVVKSK